MDCCWVRVENKMKSHLCCMRTFTRIYMESVLLMRPLTLFFFFDSFVTERTTQSVIKFIVVGALLHIKQSSSHLELRSTASIRFLTNRFIFRLCVRPFLIRCVPLIWMDLSICTQTHTEHGLSTATTPSIPAYIKSSIQVSLKTLTLFLSEPLSCIAEHSMVCTCE